MATAAAAMAWKQGIPNCPATHSQSTTLTPSRLSQRTVYRLPALPVTWYSPNFLTLMRGCRALARSIALAICSLLWSSITRSLLLGDVMLEKLTVFYLFLRYFVKAHFDVSSNILDSF